MKRYRWTLLIAVLANNGCRTPGERGNSSLYSETRITGISAEPSHVEMLPLISSTWTGEVIRWSLSSQRSTWTRNFNAKIHHFATSPDGRFIYVAGEYGLVRILNASDGTQVKNLDQPKKSSAIRVAVSSDGRKLAAIFLDETLAIFDLESEVIEQSFPRIFQWPVIRALDFSADGRRLLIADTSGAKEINLEQNRVIRTFSDPRFCQNERCIPWLSAASISSDRRLLALGSLNDARLIDTETGRELLTLGGHKGDVGAIRFLDGERAIESIGLDGTAMSWELPSLQLQSMHTITTPRIWQTVVTKDKKFIIGIDRENFDIVISPFKDIAPTYLEQGDFWQAKLRIDSQDSASLRLGFGEFGDQNINCAKDTSAQCAQDEFCFRCTNQVQAFIDEKHKLGNLTFYERLSNGASLRVNMNCGKSESDTAAGHSYYSCREASNISN